MTSNFEAECDRYARYVNAPYVDFIKRHGLDLDIRRADGAQVFDRQGRTYIDCIAGYGSLNLGHNHPRIIEAVRSRLESHLPFGWPFLSSLPGRLAEELAAAVPGLDFSLMVNSGAEAVDSALKLVRLTTGRPHVVGMQGAWHGFTLGAMSVSEPSLCRQFLPLLPETTHVPYGNLEAVAQAINDRTGAVLVEPIQAENGAIMPPPGFLAALKELCQRRGVLLIADEIKTGICKTGKFMACQREEVIPDLLLLGKSLGGGVVSLGVVMGKRGLGAKVGLSFPMSASSGAGNAIACTAALATLDVVNSEGLSQHAEAMGARLRAALMTLALRFPKEQLKVTGAGLLLGLHLPNNRMAMRVVRNCIKGGVLVMTAFCNRSCLLIEPPLVITESQIDQVADAVIEAVTADGFSQRKEAVLRANREIEGL